MMNRRLSLGRLAVLFDFCILNFMPTKKFLVFESVICAIRTPIKKDAKKFRFLIFFLHFASENFHQEE